MNHRFSTAGGLVAILLWSTTFAVARSLAEQVGSLRAGAAVYLIGGVLCLLRLRWARIPVSAVLQLSRRYVLGCGFLFVGYTVLLYLAVGLASSREQLLEVALVNYLWPAATVLLSVPLLHQRGRWPLFPGTVLALAGVVLVMTQGTRVSWPSFREHLCGNPTPYGLALVAAIVWGLYSNLARRWSKPDRHGAAEWFVPATGLVLLAMSILSPETGSWNVRAVSEAVLLGAITALAYALWDHAMRRGNLVFVAACSYLTPLLSTLISCAYLTVVPAPRLWTGCLLLVAGSLISWRSVSHSTRLPT